MTSDSHQQTCKVCGRSDKFNFDIPDDLWAVIVPAEFAQKVVCLSCFDDFATRKEIDYATSLRSLYFAGNKASFEFNVVQAVRATAP
jgi:hypothetical protein